MELRVLKYFIKIAEEENMTKAAQKLHVSQPALSKQMPVVEMSTSTVVFHRLRKHRIMSKKCLVIIRIPTLNF